MFRLSSIDCKLSSTADLLSYILYFGLYLRAKILFLSLENLLWNPVFYEIDQKIGQFWQK